jgi:hypothetical protein
MASESTQPYSYALDTSVSTALANLTTILSLSSAKASSNPSPSCNPWDALVMNTTYALTALRMNDHVDIHDVHDIVGVMGAIGEVVVTCLPDLPMPSCSSPPAVFSLEDVHTLMSTHTWCWLGVVRWLNKTSTQNPLFAPKVEGMPERCLNDA